MTRIYRSLSPADRYYGVGRAFGAQRSLQPSIWREPVDLAR